MYKRTENDLLGSLICIHTHIHTQTLRHQRLLVQQQHISDLNPLYKLVQGMDRYTADDIYRTGQPTHTSHYLTYQDTGTVQKL
jgi:hypothetical protein